MSGAGAHRVLPESPRRALVHSVCMGPREDFTALEGYPREVLGLEDWAVAAAEEGATPLTDARLPRRGGRAVLELGIRGGLLKPSTGYVFTHVQRDAELIIESLTDTSTGDASPGDTSCQKDSDCGRWEVCSSGTCR